MDERMLDDEESERLKGRIVTEDGIVEYEIPEMDESDEDLIGLSREEYLERVKQRKRAAEEAARERDKMLEEGDRLLKKGEYESAESFFAQALVYDADSFRAHAGVWISRTENFTSTDAFYQKKAAQEFHEADEKTRAFVLKQIGERLQSERERISAEAAPLKKSVKEAQDARRESFRANRNYYLVRFCILLTLVVCTAIGVGVSAYYIPRSHEITPIVCTVAFGVLCLLFALIWIIYVRKLIVAARLCRANEKLSSTEDGAILEDLLKKLACLELALNAEED